MQLLPEWAPNLHPLIIHFPIALLLIAVVVDLGALLFKKADWLPKAAVSLYVLGALGAVAAYFSGKQAADIVTFPPPSYAVISKHADLALYTTLFFGAYALVRLFLFWRKWDTKRFATGLLVVIAAIGYGLVQQTAELGGMLVFKYGVGTLTAKTDSVAAAKAPDIVIADNGSWAWGGDVDLFEQFNFLQGQMSDLWVKASEDKSSLTIKASSSEPFLLTFGPQLANVQLVAKVNLDDFNGRFALVHHVQDSNTYGFFAIKDDQARLARMIDGKVRSFDTGKITPQGWTTLKTVSSTGHFRGYVNDKLVVHGHAKDLPPGTTGLAFSGVGSIRIANLEVVSLDEAPMMNMKQENMNMEHDNMSHEESGEKHSH